MKFLKTSACCLLVFLFAHTAIAQTSYPMLMSLKPVAARVGYSSLHQLSSRYSMNGAYRVLVFGAGVTGEIVQEEKPGKKKPNPQQIQIRFTVSTNAQPGVRDFRVATPQGVSTLGQLVIARDFLIVEAEKNDTPESAQKISVPVTICGAIEKAEDVDYYKFTVDEAAALSFHVRSMRLQNKIHDLQLHSDPIITLRNAQGAVLAMNDNHFAGDPWLGYRFDKAGEYHLEIRDVRYQGNRYWQYSIEISDRPFVTNVFPLGVARGKEQKLQLVGFQVSQKKTLDLTLPAELEAGLRWLPMPLAGEEETNPAPLVVTDLPTFSENESDNNLPKNAQSVSVPVGINGRIDHQGDTDCYTFQAKKGEKFSLEVIARRHQSGLDSYLRVLDEKGKQLQVNDDMRLGKRSFADSWIENFTAPADGHYTAEIRDLHLRGGPEYVYFLKITHSRPYFELTIDTDKTQLTPGTGGVVFVRVIRKNGFQGAVQLEVSGLPAKVTARCGRILAGSQDGCILLQAAAGASMSAANITITGTEIKTPDNKNEAPALVTVAVPYQETYLPGGGRGHWPVQMHTVAVGAESDIRKVSLSTSELNLKPGESQKIDVHIERAPGFAKNVILNVIYQHLGGVHGNPLPPGVTLDASKSKTLLTGKETQGHLVLVAAKDAKPVERQQIAVMANVSINFVMKATYVAEPVAITVYKP